MTKKPPAKRNIKRKNKPSTGFPYRGTVKKYKGNNYFNFFSRFYRFRIN